MIEAIHGVGGEIRTSITSDINKTFHWSATIKAGRAVTTTAKAKKPKRRSLPSCDFDGGQFQSVKTFNLCSGEQYSKQKVREIQYFITPVLLDHFCAP